MKKNLQVSQEELVAYDKDSSEQDETPLCLPGKKSLCKKTSAYLCNTKIEKLS
jgi:hypothetical protein